MRVLTGLIQTRVVTFSSLCCTSCFIYNYYGIQLSCAFALKICNTFVLTKLWRKYRDLTTSILGHLKNAHFQIWDCEHQFFLLYDFCQEYCRSTSGRTVSLLTADLGATVATLSPEIISQSRRLSERSSEPSGFGSIIHENFTAC